MPPACDEKSARSVCFLTASSPCAKFIAKLGPVNQLRACYEAGPTGYVLYWQLTALGCCLPGNRAVAGSRQSWEQVKTDRRDAEKLARCYRAGDLTAVWIPTPAHEAIRDLVRAREDAREDQQRARQRLASFFCGTAGSRPKM